MTGESMVAPERPIAVVPAVERSPAPLLEPTPGGHAERFSKRLSIRHPVGVFVVSILAGYALLLAVTIAAGMVLTRGLLKIDAIASTDARISAWLEDQRTATLVDLSWLGSTLSGGVVIPVLVGVLLVAFLALHHWRLAAFTLFVIAVESATYRATSLMVKRDRPDVERLESLPVDASFPSGHVAASVALFGGLLLVLASRVRNRTARVFLFALVVAIPLLEIFSRMLRGMHHATDVTAGVLVGIGAIVVTVFACRAAGAASDARAHEHEEASKRGIR